MARTWKVAASLRPLIERRFRSLGCDVRETFCDAMGDRWFLCLIPEGPDGDEADGTLMLIGNAVRVD